MKLICIAQIGKKSYSDINRSGKMSKAIAKRGKRVCVPTFSFEQGRVEYQFRIHFWIKTNQQSRLFSCPPDIHKLPSFLNSMASNYSKASIVFGLNVAHATLYKLASIIP